jgi:hypothetical protein
MNRCDESFEVLHSGRIQLQQAINCYVYAISHNVAYSNRKPCGGFRATRA